MWMHRNADKKICKLNNSAASKCLQGNHKLTTVGEAEQLASYLYTPRHQNTSECECQSCLEIEEETRCRNPNTCFKKAEELLISKQRDCPSNDWPAKRKKDEHKL